MGAGASVNEVHIDPVQLSKAVTSALQRLRSRAELHRIECHASAAEAANVFKWLDLAPVNAKSDVCTLLETILGMTHLNYRITRVHGNGSYGVVLLVTTARKEILIVKLALLTLKKEFDSFSNAQFGQSVRVHRALQHATHASFAVPELKEVMRIDNGGKKIGVTCMSFVEGKLAYDVLKPLIANETNDNTVSARRDAVVKMLAMALAELHKDGYVHGDAHLRNFIIHGDKVTLIDFDFSSVSDEGDVDITKILANLAGMCYMMSKDHIPIMKLFIRTYFGYNAWNDMVATMFGGRTDYSTIERIASERYDEYRDTLP